MRASRSEAEVWGGRQVGELRHRGYRGMTILGHRAFRTLPLQPLNIIVSGALATILTLIWLTLRPSVGRFWTFLFQVWFRWLDLPATVTITPSQDTYFSMPIPQVGLAGAMPTPAVLILVAILTLAVFLACFRLPTWLTPVTYFLRALCFVQVTALLYFWLFPRYFPHDVPHYLSTMLSATIGFISAIPAIMGFTFYIFDFTVARKIILTGLIMAHVIILAPFQYVIHAYVLAKWSLLFMPQLYIVFGLLPQIAIFIAFYSWGMSWSEGSDETPS
jgi:hypothetical protein